MTKLSTGAKIASEEVNDLASSPAFTTFAKQNGIEASNKAAWLMNVIRSSMPQESRTDKEQK